MDKFDWIKYEEMINKSLYSGHGHVLPAIGKMKSRCGGPSICEICRKEILQLQQQLRMLEDFCNVKEELGTYY